MPILLLHVAPWLRDFPVQCLQLSQRSYKVRYPAGVASYHWDWPAHSSGKSWDKPSDKTGSGNTFYRNIIPGSAVVTEEFSVAIIIPVIHYCTGGLDIHTDLAVLSTSTGVATPGRYAAGEVTGGVHGNNRLGGNSLANKSNIFLRHFGSIKVDAQGGLMVYLVIGSMMSLLGILITLLFIMHFFAILFLSRR